MGQNKNKNKKQMSVARKYIKIVDEINKKIGQVVMFGIFAMMAVLLWSTISKFGSRPSLWTLEAAQFAMIAYFFLGGPYAIQTKSHVRMDLFYQNWSKQKKAIVDAITVICLIVYLSILLWGGINSTAYSLGYFGAEPMSFFAGLITGNETTGTLERSRTIWRPYLWPIKIVLCIGITLMIMQATAEMLRNIIDAKNNNRRSEEM